MIKTKKSNAEHEVHNTVQLTHREALCYHKPLLQAQSEHFWLQKSLKSLIFMAQILTEVTQFIIYKFQNGYLVFKFLKFIFKNSSQFPDKCLLSI